jgi:SAM-dependent methyltransferase
MHKGHAVYYSDKVTSLRAIFGCDAIEVNDGVLIVGNRRYPIVDDVIVLLDESQYPPSLRSRLTQPVTRTETPDFSDAVQFSFGEEWQTFSEILPEHEKEFLEYFDLVDLSGLGDARIYDLGCGIGRWSYFLKDRCRQLVLVDFSDAIFVARRNLSSASNALFFMGDLTRLPFADESANFLFCIGVLHHLPVPALDVVRRLKRLAPTLLIYLYYSLDNRPVHYRTMLTFATTVRRLVSQVRDSTFRSSFTWMAAITLYLPLILVGKALRPIGLSKHVPLYEGYQGKSLRRIRQDVYDRFFTTIEQRFSRSEILVLHDTFASVRISGGIPYWHFVCER